MRIEHMLIVLVVIVGLYLAFTGNHGILTAWNQVLNVFHVQPDAAHNIWSVFNG